MKLSTVICGPDVDFGPLALIDGPFDEKLSKARQFGYKGIELMIRDPRLLDFNHIRTILKKEDLVVTQIVTGELFGADRLCIVTPDEEILRQSLDRIQAVIELAREIGGFVNIGRFRGRLDWMNSREEGYQIALERIGWVANWAQKANVSITIEPINRYEVDFIHNADEGLRFLDDLRCSNVGLMLDLFHMNIEDRSIIDSLTETMTAGKLWHIHVADSNRRYPGRGHLDFIEIINTLKKIGYDGYLSAELLPEPDADRAAFETATFLRHLV